VCLRITHRLLREVWEGVLLDEPVDTYKKLIYLTALKGTVNELLGIIDMMMKHVGSSMGYFISMSAAVEYVAHEIAVFADNLEKIDPNT